MVEHARLLANQADEGQASNVRTGEIAYYRRASWRCHNALNFGLLGVVMLEKACCLNPSNDQEREDTMPWPAIFVVILLFALLVFGLVGYWRGKGISSCCDSIREPKDKVING